MATKLTNLHPSIEERTAAGKALRDRVSRKSQGKWKPAANRPDPIELLKRALTKDACRSFFPSATDE